MKFELVESCMKENRIFAAQLFWSGSIEINRPSNSISRNEIDKLLKSFFYYYYLILKKKPFYCKTLIINEKKKRLTNSIVIFLILLLFTQRKIFPRIILTFVEGKIYSILKSK